MDFLFCPSQLERGKSFESSWGVERKTYVDVAVWGAKERVQKLGRDELFQAWECWNPWLGLPWLSGEPCGTQVLCYLLPSQPGGI